MDVTQKAFSYSKFFGLLDHTSLIHEPFLHFLFFGGVSSYKFNTQAIHTFFIFYCVLAHMSLTHKAFPRFLFFGVVRLI